MEPQRRRAPWEGIPISWQRSILFVAGLAFLAHEATLPAAEVSWPRLLVIAGMMGLPFALKADDVRRALTPPESQEPQE